jgi:TolB-like protein/Tfp pilus assembly protein PilF
MLAVGMVFVTMSGSTNQLKTGHSVLLRSFENLTSHADNAHIAAGTSGELARRLSRVPGLIVYAARESLPANERVRATYNLAGQVQENGETLRVTTELTRVSDGSVVWSQSFEGTRARALELQDRIAAEAVEALTRAGFADGGPDRLTSLASLVGGWWPWRGHGAAGDRGTTSNEAYDAYLRGRYLFEDRTEAGALAAITYLRRAVELDPKYAAPHAALADVQAVLMDVHYAPHDHLLAEADREATTAVALDPDLPEAQMSLAAVRQMQSRWAEAEAAYRRAIELHPRFARAHRWLGGMYLQFGRVDEALRLMDRALELDPYDYPSQSAYGLSLFYARRPLDAAAHLEHLLERNDHLHAHLILGQVYSYLAHEQASRRDEFRAKALAQSEILRVRETSAVHAGGRPGRTEYADFVAALAHSYSGDLASATPHVGRLEAGWRDRTVSPSILARVYAVQGRTDAALAALEAAAAERDRALMYLTVSPHYDRIREEARFRSLVRQMRLD